MKTYKFISIILLIINQIIIYSQNTNDDDEYQCPIDMPLLMKNNKNECIYDYFDENKYIIANKIIKIQWLNKRNQLGFKDTWYTGLDFSSKGDLIIQAILYVRNNGIDLNRYFYGIKQNGRALFYDKYNNKFINQIMINSTTSSEKYEYQFIRINLVNDEEKDYYLSPAYSNYSIETIDFYNNKIIGIPQAKIFGNSSWSSFVFSILELNNEKIYLISFIKNENSNSYIVFQKYKFFKIDISQDNSYEKIISSTNKEELKVYNSVEITCIEIVKFNLIECFYININGFLTLGFFEEDSFDLVLSKIIEEQSVGSLDNSIVNIYHQCIHLKKEISVLGYMLDKDISDIIYIQIKQIIYNKYSKYELENYLLNYKKIQVNIEKKIINFRNLYCLSHLKKINDNKFSLVSVSHISSELFIILFDIYNFRDTNLFIKYYFVPLMLYNCIINRNLLSVNFNGFIGVVYSFLRKNQKFTDFLIFSYIDSIDSEVIICEQNTKLKLNQYINSTLIENNVFGVELYGIKILKLPNSNKIGIYYFSREKNNLIYENDILSPEDEIYFIYDYDNLKIGNTIYCLEMAGVVIEPLYSKLINFTIHTEFYGKAPPEYFYQQRILIGKTSFYNFTIPNSIKGNNIDSCTPNCKICNNNICLKCIDNFILIEDTNDTYTCQTNFIKEGYYYDERYMVYKKCHDSCKTCSNGPIYYIDILEIEDTNCNECIQDYYKIENTNNCVNKDKVPLAYYLDINKKYFFKCYENCMTCKSYKKNSTYLNCMSCDENSVFYPKSTNCLNCSRRDKYVNYYQYDCIDFIPDGYYLYNTENNEIDLCYITCKHCNSKGNSKNHKCIECSDAYPYSYKNGTKCLDDCSKENLFADLITKNCYDDCKDNVNERTCNYKNICLSQNDHPKNYKLDENYNFVSICNPQTEYEFNNECYNSCPDGTKIDQSVTTKNLCICNNLYYLNEEDQICVYSNICPNDYPYLKIGTSICSDCPVTYKEKCYLECPENTCITQINENLAICVDELDETKILGGICFDDFIRILDNVEELDSNENIVQNNFPGVTVNIYEDGIDISEVKNKYPNLTFINLDECGEEIKRFYNLNSDEKLYIISADILTKISNQVTNDYGFEIYLKNGTELDYLIICNNIPISLSSSIIKLDLAHFNEAEIFNSQGYDI